jgi:hypothetical protein
MRPLDLIQIAKEKSILGFGRVTRKLCYHCKHVCYTGGGEFECLEWHFSFGNDENAVSLQAEFCCDSYKKASYY